MSIIPIERNPVTLDDLERMLELFAGLDGHPRAANDIELWDVAATAGRWTRAQVAAAALTIASSWTGFRVQPGHVSAQIAADRERIRLRWHCPDPPRELASDPQAELVWRRNAYANFADRALLAVASGQPIEDVPISLHQDPYTVAALTPGEKERRLELVTGSVGQSVPETPEQAPDPDPIESDRAARAALRARRYALIDACDRCDPGGMQLRHGLPTDIVCRHPAPVSSSKSGLDEERRTSVDHRVAV